LNKQLAVQNTKISTNLSDLRGQVMSEAGREEGDLFRGIPSFHPTQSHDRGSAPDDVEILERKKAWAELEREENENKRQMKSLMKLEPSTRVIDDPSMADRVSGVRMQPQQYNTVEDMATEKRMRDPTGFERETGQDRGSKPASPAQPVGKLRPQHRESSHDSKPNGSAERKSENQTQKRQWAAPTAVAEEEKRREPAPSSKYQPMASQ
jgi:hypothetical protein